MNLLGSTATGDGLSSSSSSSFYTTVDEAQRHANERMRRHVEQLEQRNRLRLRRGKDKQQQQQAARRRADAVPQQALSNKPAPAETTKAEMVPPRSREAGDFVSNETPPGEAAEGATSDAAVEPAEIANQIIVPEDVDAAVAESTTTSRFNERNLLPIQNNGEDSLAVRKQQGGPVETTTNSTVEDDNHHPVRSDPNTYPQELAVVVVVESQRTNDAEVNDPQQEKDNSIEMVGADKTDEAVSTL